MSRDFVATHMIDMDEMTITFNISNDLFEEIAEISRNNIHIKKEEIYRFMIESGIKSIRHRAKKKLDLRC